MLRGNSECLADWSKDRLHNSVSFFKTIMLPVSQLFRKHPKQLFHYFSPTVLILNECIASDGHRMLHSNLAAVVEQPVSYSHLPVCWHPLGVLVPANLGLRTFLSSFSCRHLLQDTVQEWNVQTFLAPGAVLCQSRCSGSAGVVALALPRVWFHWLLQHLVPSLVALQRERNTSVFWTSSNRFCFHTETQILFQGVKCLLKWDSRVWRSSWPQSSLPLIRCRATGAVWNMDVSQSWISWLMLLQVTGHVLSLFLLQLSC